MKLDGKLLARARERLAGIKEQNQALHEERLAEIYARLPSIKAIDGELRALFADVLSVTLKERSDRDAILAHVEARSAQLCAEKGEILAANGYAPDYLEEISRCPHCGDSGYTPKGSMCSCLLALYEEEKARELSSVMKLSGDCFQQFDLNYYTGSDRVAMELVYDYCRRYAAGFGEDSPNLIFRGDTGLGKTFLSQCIARAVSESGHSVVYESVQEAFAAFEEAKFRHDPEAEEKTRRILSCQLLILDDLGTELITGFTQSALYHIINTRLIHGRKTIISTNLSPQEIEESYNKQIASRLLGEFDPLSFRGRDIRAIKKAQKYT